MGSLIALSEFFRGVGSDTRSDISRPDAQMDSFWYFVDASRHHERYFDVQQTYPHKVFVHIDWLTKNRNHYEGGYGHNEIEAGLLRVQLREWIEQNIAGAVVYARHDLDYYRAYPGTTEKDGWEHEIAHGYYAFYFRSLAEATHFRLRFATHTQITTSRRHPAFPKDGESIDVREPWAARTIISRHSVGTLDLARAVAEHEIEF